MRQVLQNLGTGITELADVPSALCRSGHLLIATRRSLISSGTERRLCYEFEERVGNLLEVKVRYVPRLSRTRSGKQKFVVSEVALTPGPK